MTWVSSHPQTWGHSWSPQAVAITTVAGVGHPWYLQPLQWLRQQPPPEPGVQLQGARGKHCAGLRKHLGDERHLGGGWHSCWLCWQDIVAGRQTKCMSMHTETSGQCFLICPYILSPQLICSQTKSRREMETVWSYVGRYAVSPANREAQESQPTDPGESPAPLHVPHSRQAPQLPINSAPMDIWCTQQHSPFSFSTGVEDGNHSWVKRQGRHVCQDKERRDPEVN